MDLMDSLGPEVWLPFTIQLIDMTSKKIAFQINSLNLPYHGHSMNCLYLICLYSSVFFNKKHVGIEI